jgi:hypothetical protein
LIVSHRIIIIKSNKVTVEYALPDEATPEQVGAEAKRITKHIDKIESGAEE